MSDPFASGGSSGVNLTDFEGKLLLITGTEHLTGEDKVKTAFGEKDVVVADVVVLDGDETEEHSGVYGFQSKLIGVFKRHVGKRPFLGRLGKGDTKKNGNYPWELKDPSDADKAVARKYLEDRAAKAEDPFAAA